MVAIKDIKMPKNCEECRIHICAIIDKNIDYEYANEINPNCPLVDIVTCKDCVKGHKYKNVDECYCDYLKDDVDIDFFCAEAERRE